jgi:hypothetical protein
MLVLQRRAKEHYWCPVPLSFLASGDFATVVWSLSLSVSLILSLVLGLLERHVIHPFFAQLPDCTGRKPIGACQLSRLVPKAYEHTIRIIRTPRVEGNKSCGGGERFVAVRCHDNRLSQKSEKHLVVFQARKRETIFVFKKGKAPMTFKHTNQPY